MKKILLFVLLISSSAVGFSQTIAEIQGDGDESPLLGQIVTTTGTITGIAPFGFYIQDAEAVRSGIFVFDDMESPVLGDNVSITGTVEEYFELTEITTLTNFEVLSSGNTINPMVVSTGSVDEDYEGVLVQVNYAVCTDPDLGYGEFSVNDGSGNVRVDDQIYFHEAVENESYTVIGPATFSFGNYKIIPRSAGDVSTTAVSVKDIDRANLALTLSPNPVSNTLYVDAPESGTLNVFNVSGKLMKAQAVQKGSVQMDLSQLSDGMYFFRLNNYSGKVMKR